MKKFTSSLMACVAMCAIIATPITSTLVSDSGNTISLIQMIDANAASVRKCFTISTTNTPVYSNTNLSSKIGSIYPTDEIVVNDVTSKYTKVTYPISGGKTKTGYIATSAILTGTTGNTYKAKGSFTTYKRNTTDSKLKYGSVSKNDQCVVLGTKGGMVQIKYPVSGGFKYAFCTANDAKTYLGYEISSPSPVSKWDSISNGTYTIVPKCAQGSCIDVSEGATNNGTKIHQWSKGNNQANQLWNVMRNSDGSFSFYAKHCNKAADLNGNNIWNGNKIALWDKNTSNAQKFWLKSEGDGWYSIRCFNNTNYAWDINGGVANNGAQLQCYQYNKSNAQLFKFVAYSAPNPVNNNQPAVSSNIAWPIDGAKCTWSGPGSQWSWGTRNGSSARSYHLGCDIKGSNNNIKAFASGTVVATGYNGRKNVKEGNGNYVIIEHSISGKTVYSFYAHLSEIKVSNGQKLNQGALVGIMGSTGNSSGPHLHFAIVDKRWDNGGYYGYGTQFSGNKVSYSGVTYYSPYYVVNNKKLP